MLLASAPARAASAPPAAAKPLAVSVPLTRLETSTLLNLLMLVTGPNTVGRICAVTDPPLVIWLMTAPPATPPTWTLKVSVAAEEVSLALTLRASPAPPLPVSLPPASALTTIALSTIATAAPRPTRPAEPT